MELRRLSLYMALFVLAICSQSCSDAHSVQRRSVDDIYDDDTVMGDEATDDEAQNDAEDNTADDEDILESITTRPTTYNVTVGQTVRLECKVSPNNKPVIQWLKGEEPLYMGKQYMKNSHDERIKISPDEGNHDLFISQLRASDSGRYRCKVLQLPQPAIIDHELVVMEKPRIDAFKASNNGTVMEGTDVLLTCDVTGSPAPQIIWSAVGENGMNARLTEKDASFNYNTALIKSIRPDQAGRYLCYVINSQGAAQAELRIRVLHKPHVHVHKQIVNSAPGIEATLQCSAHGEPIPHIVWYKDGRMVDFNDMKYVINTEGPHSNLTVTPTEDNDFGTFTCEARNLHGIHNNSIELAQRPVVEGLDLDGNKLTWKVHSHQPLEQIELQLRDTQGVPTSVNVPVPETKNHEYEVIYVLDNVDQGTYEVVVKAKNNKEWSSASEPIVVNYEVPLPIQTASIYHGNSHSIRPAANVVLSTVFMYLLVRLF